MTSYPLCNPSGTVCCKDLETILKHYIGLFSLKPKVPIKDQYSLSLVYTPGVGKSCLEIKDAPEKSYVYTNRANSIILLTDSSAFTHDAKKKWNNLASIPYLEIKCAYYKLQTNIDAYPIVLDMALIKDENDVIEVIENLAPAYAGFELLYFSEHRLNAILKHYSENHVPGILFTYKERSYLIDRLENYKILNKVDVELIIGCALRAAIDTQSHIRFPLEILDVLIHRLSSQPDLLSPENYYRLATQAVTIFAQELINRGHAKSKRTVKDIEYNFMVYLLEGSHAWIERPCLDNITLCNSINENSLDFHKRYKGMIEVEIKIKPKDPGTLVSLFHPSNIEKVAEYIVNNPKAARDLTCKGNLCAIITNGTAILGFGDIGPSAGLPVMEGKSCLFKQLGGVDLMPICLKEKNPTKLIEIVKKIAPIFSMINLEDIKAPECFDIEEGLIKSLNIPVFHDDQHGTAIICLAGIINALKVADKKIEDANIIINGAGAAGITIARILGHVGAKNIIACDTKGAIYAGRPENMNEYKNQLASFTNPTKKKGTLHEVIKGSDVIIGVSGPGTITGDMIKTMANKPIIFALANPEPEIYPDDALNAGAYVVATGRSDFPNQINNSLVFPGLFRGCLDVQAEKITIEMQVAASHAIAQLVREQKLKPDHIIPNALDLRVPQKVARAVAEVSNNQGVSRKSVAPEIVEDKIRGYLVEGMLRCYNAEKKL